MSETTPVNRLAHTLNTGEPVKRGKEGGWQGFKVNKTKMVRSGSGQVRVLVL